MLFWRKPKINPLRDAANVIADAIEIAKGQTIADIDKKLAAARIEAKLKRVALKQVLRQTDKVMGSVIEENIRQLQSEMIGGNNIEGNKS